MHLSPVATRLPAAAALLAALALSGCGGGDPDSTESPAPTSQSAVEGSSSPTPSESGSESAPTPSSPSTSPLSRFEDDPQVEVARKYAAAVGRAVNKDDRQLRGAWPFMSDNGKQVLPGTMAEDMPHDFPGPLPFTPRAVGETGADRGVVRVCLQVSGWATDAETGLPVGEREILPAKFVMARVGGAWKVDDLQTDIGDCSKISVKGVPW